MTKEEKIRRSWPKKQNILNFVYGGISLWQFTQALERVSRKIEKIDFYQFVDLVTSDMRDATGHRTPGDATGRRLTVGPHSDGHYYEICLVPKNCDEVLAACRRAMKNPAIDDRLPVWAERKNKGKPERRVLDSDQSQFRICFNTWQVNPD